jgi:hypothetical protein
LLAGLRLEILARQTDELEAPCLALRRLLGVSPEIQPRPHLTIEAFSTDR